MLKIVGKFFSVAKNEEKGASAVEYALIAGLIAVAIIGAVTLLGEQMETTFTAIKTAITPAP
jgi:pilus assembly protein Flp/PilA